MKIKKDKLKAIIYPAAFILIAGLSLAYKLLANGTEETFISTVKGESVIVPAETSVSSETPAVELPASSEETPTVQVYICGAVVSPGVYELPQGVILNDVITCAGGFTPEADITKVNLVYEIESNISVFIPDTCQTDQTVSQDVFAAQDELIRDDDEYVWGEGITVQPEGYTLVNINTADKDTLMTLPGIGEVSAQSIIDYREQSPFGTIEEIKNVSGIGDAKFEKIKPYITV